MSFWLVFMTPLGLLMFRRAAVCLVFLSSSRLSTFSFSVLNICHDILHCLQGPVSRNVHNGLIILHNVRNYVLSKPHQIGENNIASGPGNASEKITERAVTMLPDSDGVARIRRQELQIYLSRNAVCRELWIHFLVKH